MKIGAMKHRVQLQRYKEIEDGGHGTYKTWTTLATVYAEIKNVSGLVKFDTQQIGKGITHKVTIRYYPLITSENWLLMNSRRFRIRDVTNVDEGNRFLILLCEEVFKGEDPFEVDIDAVGESLNGDLPAEDS